MSGDAYKGVAPQDLRIESIRWTAERIEHIRTRTDRKGPGETNLEPEWATEAALDPQRLVTIGPPAADPRNQSIQVIGHSPSVPPLGAVLKVWLWSDAPGVSTEWNGGSAALAGKSAIRRYDTAKEGELT